MPITFETPELQTNEAFKGFEKSDDLGKAYLDLDARVKGGGIDLLPEDLRKDPAVTPFKTLSDLTKGYVETKKMVGSIEKAPEKADGYKFTPMANLHPNLQAEGIQAELMGIAHKAGLGNKAADIFQQGLIATLSAKLGQQDQARKELSQKNETALRSEWGAEYDAKVDKITKTMGLLWGQEFKDVMNEMPAQLKGSPNFLKGMGRIVSLLSEDSLKSLGDGADKPITDSTAAQAEISKYNKEIASQGQKHPFFDSKSPEHEAAKKKMTDLFALAYPGN